MADQRWERTMPCKDGLGRDRELRVFLSEDKDGGVVIGLHTPPGESALLPPRGLSQLHDLLAAARLEATHRGAEWG